jgi:hypothetical protein
MTDLELIDAATKAGLCFADCWDLAELYNIRAAEETEKWIQAAETVEEKEEKRRIANHMRLRAQEKMNNLREFASLILAYERNRR